MRRRSGGFGSPAYGMTHRVLIALVVVALVWFLMKYRRPAFAGRKAAS